MFSWKKLEAVARRVVEETMGKLPEEIRAEAEKVPCLLEEECADDPELLGVYGHFSPGEVSPSNGPIVLYLRALADYCADEDADFEEEVRLTYLHELGHHFGWDEGDLEERGLA